MKAFTDALRLGKSSHIHEFKEMKEDYPELKLTNVYPYFIETGLFQGFKPLGR